MSKPRGIYFIPTPETCDVCHEKLGMAAGTLMYDAAVRKVRGQPWACMCRSCFTDNDGRLGIGVGQEYERRRDGKFWQISGGSYA